MARGVLGAEEKTPDLVDSAGAPINAKHTTRKCEINETAAEGWRRKKNKAPIRKSLKLRILCVIAQFYRSVAFRGVPGAVRVGAH